MKRLPIYIPLLLMLICGCTEDVKFDDDNVRLSLDAHYLSISPNQFHLGSQEQTFNANIKSVSTPWTFSDMADWITADKASGDQDDNVTFNATQNPFGDKNRTAVFYLTSQNPSYGIRSGISVSQEASSPYLDCETKSISFDGKGGTQNVKYTANVTPTIDIDYDYSSAYNGWLSAKVGEDGKSIDITAKENNSGRARTGYVRLNYRYNAYVTIEVKEDMPNITTSDSYLNFENTAGTYKLTITSDASWTATTDESWIQVSPNKGNSGTTEIEISAAPNTSTSDRTGHVYFKIGDLQLRSILVTQRGIYIDVRKSIEMLSSKDSYNLTVQSNTQWTATSDAAWLSINPSSGSGKQDVTVSVDDNPSLSNRVGHIYFTSVAGNIKDMLSVNQAGKEFSVNETLVNFSDKAGTASVKITAEGSWTATPQDNYDWLSFSPMAANGNSNLNISVKENLSTSERIGYINITMLDKTYQIAVHQQSKYFNVTSEVLKFTSHGGTSSVDVSTNDKWTAAVEDNKSWLNISKTSGEGNAKFEVSAGDNATTSPRAAYVDVISTNAGTVRLNYEQAGRYLTVDRSDFTFFAGGGTSTLTTISTDGKYKMSQEGGWFSINKLGDYTFTVTASENNTKGDRTGSITIELTDLKEGEAKVVLPVKQVASGATFTIGGYTTDQDWNLFKGHNATLTVKGFTSDKNWNVENTTKGAITFTNYGTDKSWNDNHQSNSDLNNNNYGSDQNWNDSHNSDSNIGRTDYGNDNNWNNN